MKQLATKTTSKGHSEKEINDLIDRIKAKTNMNQEQIAKEIGYNRSYLSQAKKTDSEKLYTALYSRFKDELENITSTQQKEDSEYMEELRSKKDKEPLEQAILNLSEADLRNAKNIERLIGLLEAKMNIPALDPTLAYPGKPGTSLPKKKQAQ